MSHHPWFIRTVGGPHPGDRLWQTEGAPPAELPDEGGRYTEVSRSKLEQDHPHVMRGVVYRWEPDAE